MRLRTPIKQFGDDRHYPYENRARFSRREPLTIRPVSFPPQPQRPDLMVMGHVLNAEFIARWNQAAMVYRRKIELPFDGAKDVHRAGTDG